MQSWEGVDVYLNRCRDGRAWMSTCTDAEMGGKRYLPEQMQRWEGKDIYLSRCREGRTEIST